jgi:hypothetical protein
MNHEKRLSRHIRNKSPEPTRENFVALHGKSEWTHTMTIDIDDLDEDQLLELNDRIITRLNYLEQRRAQEAMLKFAPGERVQFTSKDGSLVEGVILKYNRKTVVIATDSGKRWRVSPGFLSKSAAKTRQPGPANVVMLRPDQGGRAPKF